MEQRLAAYVAASAAGAGLLAAQPGEAKIIYKSANIPIAVDTGTVYLDVNGDGIDDFGFSNGYTGPNGPQEGNHASSVLVGPAHLANRVWAIQSDKHVCAAALEKGETIGPGSPFEKGNSLLPMAFGRGNSISGSAGCPWVKVTEHYLGFKFAIKGRTHFGWARVKMGGLGNIDYIVGYAYETVADTPIVSGATSGPSEQPRTLGELALGTTR